MHECTILFSINGITWFACEVEIQKYNIDECVGCGLRLMRRFCRLLNFSVYNLYIQPIGESIRIRILSVSQKP